MDSQLMIRSEQLLRYRELLALSYAQKDAIKKGDLVQFASLLDVRQELIARARMAEEMLNREPINAPDDDPETQRRLMTEAAMLLEKLVSLDKENERLLEVRMATTNGLHGVHAAKTADGPAAYSRGNGPKRRAPGVVDTRK